MSKLESKISTVRKMKPAVVESLARNTKTQVDIRAIWEIIKDHCVLDDIQHLFNARRNDSSWLTPSQVIDGIIDNKHTPADVLQSMFDSMKSKPSNNFRLGDIAAHENATIDMIEVAICHKSVSVRERAATSSKLNHAHRKTLVNDKSLRVRRAVAESEGAEEDILLALINDKSTCVKIQVLRHPNVTEEMITIGMQDNSSSVRRLAMIHDRAPLDSLIKYKVESVIKSIVKNRDGDAIVELTVRAKIKEMFKDS